MVEEDSELDDKFLTEYKDIDIADLEALTAKKTKPNPANITDPGRIFNSDEKEEIKNDMSSFRIIYSSRTHSQIREFISELKKTRFSDLRVVHLGARVNYCILLAFARDNNFYRSQCAWGNGPLQREMTFAEVNARG